MRIFFEKCPSDKFLNPAHPECSCKEYTTAFTDYGVLNLKFGSWFYTANGTGTFFPILFFVVLGVALMIVCAPAVYFFSYRMSRRELHETHREEFFIQWHQQRLSSLICLLLICLGFVLLMMGVSGQSEIDIAGLVKTTALPGVIFALMGFLTWRIILSRGRQQAARARAGSTARRLT